MNIVFSGGRMRRFASGSAAVFAEIGLVIAEQTGYSIFKIRQ